MKTTLPLPQQADFMISLPPRVWLHTGTDASIDETGTFAISRHQAGLKATLPPAMGRGLLRALQSEAGLEVAKLPPALVQLIMKLAGHGMLRVNSDHDASETVQAVDFIRHCQDEIAGTSLLAFPPEHPLSAFMRGELDRSVVPQWVAQNYKFTKSAPHHISPVLDHPMSAGEHDFWIRFLEDESWHWRIYKPILHQFQLSHEHLDEQCDEMPATKAFISALRDAALQGPVVYACVLMYVEKSPNCLEYTDDPFFNSLVSNYGVSEASIGPLWWHTTENLRAGHTDLASVIISRRNTLDRQVLDSSLLAIRNVIHAVADWQAEMLKIQEDTPCLSI